LARAAYRRSLDIRALPSVVSFTFDDVPQSACTVGARIIEEAGGRATYYVCGAFAGACLDDQFFTQDDLRRLHAAGHEIGSHGFAHLDYQSCSFAEMVADLDRNDAFFDECGLPPATQFAFPFGSVNPRVKRYCAERFASSRGVQSIPNRQTVDPALLKAVHLYDCSMSEQLMNELLEAARDPGTWLIFLCHGVPDRQGMFGCSPSQLNHAVRRAQALGLPMLTISQALHHFGVPAMPAPPEYPDMQRIERRAG
jgi:peptidoglycan/xylan/chitin deacetylase (PgdA/CDA1 family)